MQKTIGRVLSVMMATGTATTTAIHSGSKFGDSESGELQPDLDFGIARRETNAATHCSSAAETPLNLGLFTSEPNAP
jgi:hypothetical protein